MLLVSQKQGFLANFEYMYHVAHFATRMQHVIISNMCYVALRDTRVLHNKPKNMNILSIEKPDFNSIKKSDVLEKATADGVDFYEHVKGINEPVYLYWDRAKYKHTPSGLNPTEFWYLVKQIRKLLYVKTEIKTPSGDYFSWIKLSYTDEFLHKIDTHTGGQIFVTYETISKETKHKFLSRGIIEEAIASSQLEGAHTTRAEARKMIVEKRKPRTPSEKMIMNNYNTMSAITEEFKDKELSKDMLFDLHSMLTEDTIDISEQNRFRTDEENIVVGSDTTTTFIPPKVDFIEKEIPKLINFANDREREHAGFIHPVIKAIFLHFWMGYLHPFTDGNGRLARALFYWYLVKSNYWTFMYLPISSIIKKSPAQYSKAFIYSEQDEYDLTYFYDYHLRKIIQAIDEFDNYVKGLVLENKKVENTVKGALDLNERQKQLLHYLISEGEDGYVTTTSHGTLNNISRHTAYRDIRYLLDEELLNKKKVGKHIHYFASNKLTNSKEK